MEIKTQKNDILKYDDILKYNDSSFDSVSLEVQEEFKKRFQEIISNEENIEQYYKPHRVHMFIEYQQSNLNILYTWQLECLTVEFVKDKIKDNFILLFDDRSFDIVSSEVQEEFTKRFKKIMSNEEKVKYSNTWRAKCLTVEFVTDKIKDNFILLFDDRSFDKTLPEVKKAQKKDLKELILVNIVLLYKNGKN